MHPDSGIPNLSVRLGVDASGFDLDAPLPELQRRGIFREEHAGATT